jgi:hypothetical protein
MTDRKIDLVIRQSIRAFYLTTILYSLTIFYDSDTRSIGWFLIALFITGISYGLPNAFFLLILYFFKIGRLFLMNTRYLLLEILFHFIIFFSVDYIVSLIPINYRYYSTPTEIGQKFAFQAGAIIFYSYIVLFFLITAIELILKKKRNSSPRCDH